MYVGADREEPVQEHEQRQYQAQPRQGPLDLPHGRPQGESSSQRGAGNLGRRAGKNDEFSAATAAEKNEEFSQRKLETFLLEKYSLIRF